MLLWLILIPTIGAFVAPLSARWPGGNSPRWIALASLGVTIALLAALLIHSRAVVGDSPWIAQIDRPWIPQLGIRLHLALDGISLLLIALTLSLGAVAVFSSWKGVTYSIGFFHFNVLLTLAGVIGVFLAFDLMLFFLLWELMLVPMYFLIAIWGHEQRTHAAIKFFIFTQGGGLLMLISILILYFTVMKQTGILTFDYRALSHVDLEPRTQTFVMLGFFVAFAVKLPSVPLHTWLADAHSQAPTAGSVILAGLLLKTGAYGLLRFAIPLFPDASMRFAPIAMALGAAGVIYGAVLSFAQQDSKRLVAYTSVSHLGFVLIGIYAWNAIALQGAVMQMLAHGLSTGALFVLVGALQDRLHTRDMTKMGGLWSEIPRLSSTALFFAMASLGLPGLGDFVGEFLVLQGAYFTSPLFSVLGAIGFILSAVYALAFVQRVFYGKNGGATTSLDLSPLETAIIAVMMAASVWLGLYPQPVLEAAKPGVREIQRLVADRSLGRQ